MDHRNIRKEYNRSTFESYDDNNTNKKHRKSSLRESNNKGGGGGGSSSGKVVKWYPGTLQPSSIPYDSAVASYYNKTNGWDRRRLIFGPPSGTDDYGPSSSLAMPEDGGMEGMEDSDQTLKGTKGDGSNSGSTTTAQLMTGLRYDHPEHFVQLDPTKLPPLEQFDCINDEDQENSIPPEEWIKSSGRRWWWCHSCRSLRWQSMDME